MSSLRDPEQHFEESQQLAREKLGRELTAREKFYIALADACAPRRAVVLCIEDNKAQREMRKEILETGGFLVVCASTGAEAIEIVRETPVSLVLSDHMLSGTSGADLAAEIKQIKPDVPVVLYSGRPPESMENIDCFMNKGESVLTFLSMMRDVVNRYWGVIHSSQQPR